MTKQIDVKWPVPGYTITTQSGIQYLLGTQLASGGYALVFEGTDTFGNPVALKVYKPANRPFGEVKAQWEKECGLFRKLRHPNVVAIYDAFVCDNLFYIVLERAWGTICQWIQAITKANEPQVKEIGRQLLFAIHFVHTNRVLHRDITMYNTLVFHGPQLTGGLTYKISDFGISKEFLFPWQKQETRSHTAHPCFMPPELLSPQHGYTNQRSDLYHLGLILLYALTGSLPFNDAMPRDEINRLITEGAPRQQAERIGTPLGNFIAVLLRRSNEYRFSSALEAWQALGSTG